MRERLKIPLTDNSCCKAPMHTVTEAGCPRPRKTEEEEEKKKEEGLWSRMGLILRKRRGKKSANLEEKL